MYLIFMVKEAFVSFGRHHVKGGGVKNGVLLGFIHGNKLHDEDQYLTRGTNKKIFYKIFLTPEQIDTSAVVKLLEEAVRVDRL
jgi:uncharacterized protein YdeI (YjbR/CyaY-like superfamily)